MRTRAAVCQAVGSPWEIVELEVSEPGPGEALVRLEHAGLCHSDYHLITGDFPAPTPVVGGHEGAGRVIAVGAGVDRVAVGDSVLFFSTAICGVCRWCASGRSHLCDANADVRSSTRPDGSYPFTTLEGDGVASFCRLGSFSEYSVVPQTRLIRYGDDIPSEVAAVASCAVATGYGSAVRAAEVSPGDTVVVIGAGGVGMSAIQGARIAGARAVVAIDPVAYKRDSALKFGATHTAESIKEAAKLVAGITGRRMAETAIMTASVQDGSMFGPVARLVSKGGTVVVTSVARWDADTITLPIAETFLSAKRIVGCVMGNLQPLTDFDTMFDLYRADLLDIDGMITGSYALDEINQGYADMKNGDTIRGVIKF